MKSRMVRRIFAVAMMAILFTNNVLPTVAETVSGGDVLTETEAGEADSQTTADSAPGKDEASENVEEGTTEETENADETTGEITDETTVSSGDAEEAEEEEEEISEDEMMTLDPVTVDGVTITVSGSKDAFKEGTRVSAVSVEPAEVVIEAAEENEQAVVKKYKAFDINLMLDGKVVQPLNGEEIKVNFEGDMLIPDAGNNEGVAVYHVDGQDNLTKMTAEVAPLEIAEETIAEETIEMTTTHFSTYVIVITGNAGEYDVTYKHFLDGKQIYKPTTETIKQNTIKTYTDFTEAGKTVGGDDYRVVKVEVKFKDGTSRVIDLTTGNTEEEVKISDEATIELSYEPIKKTDRYENGVIFYDYSVSKSKTIQVNFSTEVKINGVNYRIADITDNYIVFKKEGYGAGNKSITLKKNETLENITIAGEKYQKVEYVWNSGLKVTTVNEADINNAMTKDNASRYLVMGREADRANGSAPLYINGTNGGNANQYEGGVTESAIVQGIATGLTGDLKNVVWGKNSDGAQIVEPGYFTMTPVEGKTIYANDFRLTFDQEGNKYQLYSAASDKYGETYSRCKNAESFDSHQYAAGDLSGQFFPLDNVPSAQFIEEYCGRNHNWYFGMRYDFTFKLGDYIGDLLYTFEGDDDLWVFVDGELVLDLGGIHKTYPYRYNNTGIPNTVDLWESYFGVTERTSENWWEKANDKYDPEHEYQVTVLYMERGAYASSCYMEFVLPNVESRKIDQNYGSLSFNKTDSKTNQAVEGAVFTLYNSEGAKVKDAVSNGNGVVTFSGLTAGNYTMKETVTPEGYKESDKEWKVIVSEITNNGRTEVKAVIYDKDTAVTQITNDPVSLEPVDINFKKVYRYDHSVLLAGAEFTLRVNDKNGEVIGTAVSGEDGRFAFTGLEEGTYFLEETKAPEGYRTPETGVGLVIKVYEEDGKLNYRIESNNSAQLFYMKSGEENLVKNEKGIDVTITKKWEDAEGNEIKDAPAEQITVELWRRCEGVPNKDHIKDVVLTKENNWTETVTGLNYRGDGAITEWEYYVVEKTEVEGYSPVYSDAVMDTTTEGSYTAYITLTNQEESGSLKITKTVDKVELVHGTASFTFKIEGPDGLVLYRTIAFEEESLGGATGSVTITNLPIGEYKVTELDALRYVCVSDKEQTKEVTADEIPEFTYKNKKEFENYYSHTDNVVNKVTFTRDENGNITGSTITQEKTSASDELENR